MESAEKGSMIFADRCLSEEAIYTLEVLVNYHIDENYKGIKDILFGYDSKNSMWISKYGKRIAGQNNGDFPDSNDEEKNNGFVKNNGMTFYTGNIYENVRFYMDESTVRILDILFMVSNKVTNYRYIIDIIMMDWINNIITNGGILDKTEIHNKLCGESRYRILEVRQDIWNELKRVSKIKGIKSKDAFRSAVIDFLESRTEIIKG